MKRLTKNRMDAGSPRGQALTGAMTRDFDTAVRPSVGWRLMLLCIAQRPAVPTGQYRSLFARSSSNGKQSDENLAGRCETPDLDPGSTRA
ncbi:hypothetical protein, partial [Burkholderia gladioli]|uniref:hypothetical protein n=1 Tax=Burkholderia gladioli TaxID=28095 RepID=UPI001ABAC17C